MLGAGTASGFCISALITGASLGYTRNLAKLVRSVPLSSATLNVTFPPVILKNARLFLPAVLIILIRSVFSIVDLSTTFESMWSSGHVKDLRLSSFTR